jgi:hypothetical protein
MALRGKPPEAIKKRLKCLFFGAPSVGKTTAAIQFPKPYLIDCERGAENEQYARHLKASGGSIFQTVVFEEMVEEVRQLLTTKHQFQTVIIDPVTTVYNDLADKAEREVGSEFGRHHAEARKRWKRLGNLLMRLDMNVILTSHEKTLYAEGQTMTAIGKIYDGPKGLDYLFDLVFEIQKRGKDRVGTVRKTRVESFPEGDVFPFSYDEIAKRYGRDALEHDAQVVVVAPPKRVAELKRLLELMKLPEEKTQKWLDKAQANDWSELSVDEVEKCIDYLAKLAAGKSEAA